jgi:hypothetical protein
MNRHPYLKAYMAGALLPTWFLMAILAAFVLARLIAHWPVPIERAIVFPMAVVPNLWGLWNVLYTALRLRRFLSLGAHGALLPLLLLPAGLGLAQILDLPFVTPGGAALVLPAAVALYYLLWKHVVAFFNEVAGV